MSLPVVEADRVLHPLCTLSGWAPRIDYQSNFGCNVSASDAGVHASPRNRTERSVYLSMWL